MTFANQNHLDTETSRTTGTVKLNKKIENQMKHTQQIIHKSRSHRSNADQRNAACLSPPYLQDRSHQNIYKNIPAYIHQQSSSIPDPQSFNLTNQRKHGNLVDVVTPSSHYNYHNYTQTNPDEDTYELS